MDRPILFSAPLVRAILDGRKTVTHRPVKPQPPADRVMVDGGGVLSWCRFDQRERLPKTGEDWETLRCPFGAPGDRLYVRECWQSIGYGRGFGAELHYRADGHDPRIWDQREKHRRIIDPLPDRDDRFRPLNFGPWRPSIHMPRWASRITLEVESVRVERLQAITEEGARAEGVKPLQMDLGSYLPSFEGTWGSIYSGDLAWAANPWVWVVGFKVAEVRRG